MGRPELEDQTEGGWLEDNASWLIPWTLIVSSVYHWYF